MDSKTRKTSAFLAALFAAGLSQPEKAEAADPGRNLTSEPDKISAAMEAYVNAFKQDVSEHIDVYALNTYELRQLPLEEREKVIAETFSGMGEFDVAASNAALGPHQKIDETFREKIAEQAAEIVAQGKPKATVLPLKDGQSHGFACLVFMPDARIDQLSASYGRDNQHLQEQTRPYHKQTALMGLAHELGGHCLGAVQPVPERIKEAGLRDWYLEIEADAYAMAYARQQDFDPAAIDIWQNMRQTAFFKGDTAHFTTPYTSSVTEADPHTLQSLDNAELFNKSKELLLKGRTEDEFARDLVSDKKNYDLYNSALDKHFMKVQYQIDPVAFGGLGPNAQAETVDFATRNNQAASALLGDETNELHLPPQPTPADLYKDGIEAAVQTQPEDARLGFVQERLYSLRQEKRAYLKENADYAYANIEFMTKTDENGVSNQAKLEVLSALEGRLSPEKQQAPAPEIAPERS